jgi:IMP dehydrogenase
MRLLGKALTFDDVLLVPAYSQVLPKDTTLSTQFSRNIRLNLPLVSAAMDTVTEARLAIAIAQEGGIGIVHKNLTPQEQAAHVAKVKRYESGVVRDPVVITPEHTVLSCLSNSASLVFRFATAAKSSASSPAVTCALRPATTSRHTKS